MHKHWRQTTVSMESGRRSFTVPETQAGLGVTPAGGVRSTCNSTSGEVLLSALVRVSRLPSCCWTTVSNVGRSIGRNWMDSSTKLDGITHIGLLKDYLFMQLFLYSMTKIGKSDIANVLGLSN